MEISLKIKDKEIIVSKKIDDPDTEQIMFAIECLVKQAGLDKDIVEEYIVAWAEEIQKKI